MKTDTNQIVTLDQIEVKNLPELQGWKDKQNQIVKENPFVAVEDNKTYQEAKKHRTILLTARTDVQKQDKLIASKLKEIRTQAGNVRDELIAITQPHEDKQQDEVKRYEAEKEAERKEQQRLEEERKYAIQYQIKTFYRDWKNKISEMNFSERGDVGFELEAAIQDQSEKDLEDFNLDFAEKVNLLNAQFDERVTYLQEQEEAKKERERLAEERKKFKAEKAKYEEARKAREQAENEKREKEEAERKERERKEREQREAEQEKLRKERAEFEAERKRVADEEAAKLAKEAEEKREAEEKKRKEVEAKRLKSLQPDKEKLISFIEGIKFTEDAPKLKDKAMIDFLEETIIEFKGWKKASIDETNQIK